MTEWKKLYDLDEFGLYVLVKHELREDKELLGEKLVCEVDGGVHDAGAVRANWVGDVADVDRVQVLVVARALHKDLQQSHTISLTSRISPSVDWPDYPSNMVIIERHYSICFHRQLKNSCTSYQEPTSSLYCYLSLSLCKVPMQHLW